MFDIIINSLLLMLLIIGIGLIYGIIKIKLVINEINRTGTIKNPGYFEYLIRDHINDHIKKIHESSSK